MIGRTRKGYTAKASINKGGGSGATPGVELVFISCETRHYRGFCMLTVKKMIFLSSVFSLFFKSVFWL